MNKAWRNCELRSNNQQIIRLTLILTVYNSNLMIMKQVY